MPMDRSKYPDDWEEISASIRFGRAEGKCEKCRAPHGEYICRGTAEPWLGKYCDTKGRLFDDTTGDLLSLIDGIDLEGRMVKIILTCAHLNHDPTDNRMENLAAWCQQCHLRYDAKHHAANARRTNRKKKAVGDFFEGDTQ